MIFNHSIINAAKAAERSESVSRNFHDLGIEPNFFEAIMGNELNETQLKECRGDNGLHYYWRSWVRFIPFKGVQRFFINECTLLDYF